MDFPFISLFFLLDGLLISLFFLLNCNGEYKFVATKTRDEKLGLTKLPSLVHRSIPGPTKTKADALPVKGSIGGMLGSYQKIKHPNKFWDAKWIFSKKYKCQHDRIAKIYRLKSPRTIFYQIKMESISSLLPRLEVRS